VTLKWTHAASLDLEAVERHISRDNPDAATNTVLEIIRRVERLAEHPGLGQPGRVEGTRELVLSGLPYLFAYIHQGDTIVILRVLHGAMKWPDHF
jgi:toxin ParE1/3/4